MSAEFGPDQKSRKRSSEPSDRDHIQAGSGDFDGESTSASLLLSLRTDPLDQESWSRFVDRYASVIYWWCRTWGLQGADADDVTQAVLARLFGRLRRFEYDPSQSFRGWLRTVARNTLSDWAKDRKSGEGGSGETEVIRMLQGVEARKELIGRIVDQFDLEALEEAEHRVQARVQETTWSAYTLQTVEGLSPAEAAERLGIRVAAVMKAKSNVIKMLREEIGAIDT